MGIKEVCLFYYSMPQLDVVSYSFQVFTAALVFIIILGSTAGKSGLLVSVSSILKVRSKLQRRVVLGFCRKVRSVVFFVKRV